MLGLQFETCNALGFSATFNRCRLNHSTFFQMKLDRFAFTDSQLQGVDFTGASLINATLRQCDLLDATFERTDLQHADLTGSFNYTMDPELNRLKGARFSLSGVTGLLDKYQIEIE
jgi:uncharacterized protein YjbI with pentapeptide repeats